jgi:hypothetical protein
MKVVRMMRVLRHGLFSLAVAGLFGAGAMLLGAPRSEPVAGSVPVQYQVIARPTTIIARVVCDEGIYPRVACRVSMVLGSVNWAEATTSDQRATADQDYQPLKGEPVKILDRDGNAEVYVDVWDDKECESDEDFLVAVSGPEVQVTIPVVIVDNDC